MNSNRFLSTHLRSDKIPQFCGSHLITEDHSAKHAVLPHTHEDFLELYYVYSGEGRYMVNNQFYDVKEGDIVICNAGVLHGEDPSESRRSRSYSVAISNVYFLGLSENQLCDAETVPVISCGMLAPQIGELFHLIYLILLYYLEIVFILWRKYEENGKYLLTNYNHINCYECSLLSK